MSFCEQRPYKNVLPGLESCSLCGCQRKETQDCAKWRFFLSFSLPPLHRPGVLLFGGRLRLLLSRVCVFSLPFWFFPCAVWQANLLLYEPRFSSVPSVPPRLSSLPSPVDRSRFNLRIPEISLDPCDSSLSSGRFCLLVRSFLAWKMSSLSVAAASPLAAAKSQWDARLSEPITRKPHAMPHTMSYYAKCMLGGVLSCGLTHTAVTPLDVVKCKMQVYPDKYKGLVSGMRTVVAEEGAAGLRLGWTPTLLGYSMQGLFKFGLYEYFKDTYGNLMGEEFTAKNKGVVWLAASASAEFFADVALCPMEMVKVKMQTSPAGTWPTSFSPALTKMSEMKKETKFPFGSVVPLWSRQIPYTMAKFYFFEKVVQLFYDNIFTKPKDSYSKTTQLGITFASGYLAGVICAVVSHPADTLVSVMSKAGNKGKSFGTMINEMGYKNLFTKGLGTRVLMIGTLTGLQWWIYDSFKTFMGMGTTGGGSAKK
ncbi:putative mitochondrial phosphate carrier [Toxoplasma gondii VAND]|uniref:Putative mitochondrial phosphate carrier n=1 Tax=Toxoplasma gondii VAND TaxID=933077 RepID=A0A086Q9D1_TOXGO|nr:putative mitochondrial phosphate carrier [Toxoplasma gondii VAND]